MMSTHKDPESSLREVVEHRMGYATQARSAAGLSTAVAKASAFPLGSITQKSPDSPLKICFVSNLAFPDDMYVPTQIGEMTYMFRVTQLIPFKLGSPIFQA